MKNKLLLLAIILVLPFTLLAQSAKYQDVVYLKNGSIIHGTIIQDVPNQTIKIQTKDGDVFVYQYSDIDKVTTEPVKAAPAPFALTVDTSTWSGFIDYTEAFYGIGVGKETANTSVYGIQTINGYQHKKIYSIGVGIGVFQFPYHVFDENTTFLPLFLDGRFNFNKNHLLKPYVEYEIGYSPSIGRQPVYDADEKGGLFMNPSIGLSFQLAKKNAVNVGAGWLMQNETITGIEENVVNGNYTLNTFTLNRTFNFIQLKLGVSF